MKHNINSLIGYKIAAIDGELGRIVDFYFDDKKWNVRYLVVETGRWLLGRKVLIAAREITDCDHKHQCFNVNMTVDQIRHSPDIDTKLPVTRQMEEVLHRHHSWGFYWDNLIFVHERAADAVKVTPITEELYAVDNTIYDVHLQSAIGVSGYGIHALGGHIGHLNDYVIDDEIWRITGIVIDTHNIIGGKKVVVSVNHVDALQWKNFEVFLDISVAEVENSPAYAELEVCL
ncbi:PRC-barrel domain-containing protein [Mucilaginibacter sp. AW1-3]